MRRRITLAHLTAIDLPPPALVAAAARAGFDGVGLRLLRVTPDSPGYPLMDDPRLLSETRAALGDTGLACPDIEFVKLAPETDLAALGPLLDAGAALGARHVIAAPYDPDPSRLADRLGRLAEEAAARGLAGAVLEFFPWTPVADLAACRRVAEAAGPRAGILVDALHFDRSGSSLAELAAVPPDRLPFVHLCDAPVCPPYTTDELLHTARAHRLPPGAGGIDLGALLAALPPEVPLALEVPAPPGQPLDARLAGLMAATRRLLARQAPRD
ncbi:MAG: sugar phosphate isomerase/epimerase [Rhodobacteraceae bacterium]|nr:sugar phosphate isomerase/epimerase [Paracoccaceae bacterium]